MQNMSKLFVTLLVTLVILQHGYSIHFDVDNDSKLVDRISRSLLQIETTDSVSIDSPDETDSIDDSLESTNLSADSPDSSDSPDSTDDSSSESYDSATESPDSQDSVSSDSFEVTSDSSSSSDSDSLESSSTCNNVLVLSDGFVINDESFSGEYTYNGNGEYNIKGSGNNRIVLELVNDDSDYELVIGNQNSISSGSGDVIVYNLLLSEWTNENNPLVDGNNNENWNSDDETTTFTVSELTLQDCLGNDLGSELCSDNGTPLFDVYDCVEDENGVFQPETGNGPSTSSATKGSSNLFYFGACLMVILIGYIN